MTVSLVVTVQFDKAKRMLFRSQVQTTLMKAQKNRLEEITSDVTDVLLLFSDYEELLQMMLGAAVL
jgi:hypothetical protein